ncbi:MAG: helix-turn-helix domain-containing protein [Candidatus Dormibacteria bacterium]
MTSLVAPVAKVALRPDEAAEALGCSRRQVERLIAGGELVAFKIGRLTRVSVAALDEYVARRMAICVPPMEAAAVRQHRGRRRGRRVGEGRDGAQG